MGSCGGRSRCWGRGQADGVAVQADVFQSPLCQLVLLGDTKVVSVHGLYHIVLERAHQQLH